MRSSDIQIDAITAWIMKMVAIKHQNIHQLFANGSEKTWHENIGNNIKLRVSWEWEHGSRPDGIIMVAEGLMISSDEVSIRETASQYHAKVSKIPDLLLTDMISLPMLPSLKVRAGWAFSDNVGLYTLENPAITTFSSIIEELKSDIANEKLPKSFSQM